MKKWWTSKTVWVGLLQLIISLASYGLDAIDSGTSIAMAIAGVVTIIMRWVTDQPITSVSREFDRLRPSILRRKQAGKYGNGAREL